MDRGKLVEHDVRKPNVVSFFSGIFSGHPLPDRRTSEHPTGKDAWYDLLWVTFKNRLRRLMIMVYMIMYVD